MWLHEMSANSRDLFLFCSFDFLMQTKTKFGHTFGDDEQRCVHPSPKHSAWFGVRIVQPPYPCTARAFRGNGALAESSTSATFRSEVAAQRLLLGLDAD